MMSRDIKCRAWHKRHKQMFNYVEHITYPDGSSGVGLIGYKDEGLFAPDDDQVELMWTVGRKDCKGQEIYDHDIVYAKDYWGDSGIVFWKESELQWWIWRLHGPDEPLRTPFANGKSVFEVIGNVYENPELLGGNDDKPTSPDGPQLPLPGHSSD